MLNVNGDLMCLTPVVQGYFTQFSENQITEITNVLAKLAGAPDGDDPSKYIFWGDLEKNARLISRIHFFNEINSLHRKISTSGETVYKFSEKPNSHVLASGIRVLIAAQRLIYGDWPNGPNENSVVIAA